MPEIQVKDKLVTVEELGAAYNAGVTGVKGNAEGAYRHGDVNIAPANIGAVAKSGDTMTGSLTIDDANTTPNQYAEIARFKRQAMRDGDNVMLYIGKAFSTKNCATLLYHHAGDGSNSNYFALSAYNAAQSLRSYTDGHIELSQPLGVPYGGTGATTPAGACANIGAMSRSPVSIYGSDSESLSNDIQSAVFNIPVYTGTLVYFYYAGGSDNVLTYGATYSGIIHRISEDGYFFTGSFTNNVGQMIIIYRSGSGGFVSYKRVI